jgi:hypothetical protein
LWHGDVATAQEVPEPAVHWAYASYFGTGWYKISDQQSAFIANFAPILTSGKTRWFGGRDGEAVYSMRVPVTVGLARLDFEDVPGILDLENFTTVSAGLRADVDVPVTERFSWRPSLQLSYGTVIGESEYAWTYRGDVRARYMPGSGDLDWALIGAVGLVGYDANRSTDDSFTYAAFGTEFAYPLPWFASMASAVHGLPEPRGSRGPFRSVRGSHQLLAGGPGFRQGGQAHQTVVLQLRPSRSCLRRQPFGSAARHKARVSLALRTVA